MSANFESPTFVFHNGKVFAIEDGKVIASGDEIEEVEEIVKKASNDCPCGNPSGSCSECGGGKKKSKTMIVTPNGIKGRIVGRHRDIWGEEVTIRLENGRIASFNVTSEEDIHWAEEEQEVEDKPIDKLKKRLDEGFEKDRESLSSRLRDLQSIRREASTLIANGVSYQDEQELDRLVTTADYEMGEVAEAIEQIVHNEGEAFAPPAPYRSEVVEQESLGGDATWIDEAAKEMAEENASQDFNKLMDEGPELFVADLEAPALGDARTVREMASNFLASKTAGIDAEAKEDFHKTFLGRIEKCRRLELARRKQKIRKQAKKEANHDGPAEGLFL